MSNTGDGDTENLQTQLTLSQREMLPILCLMPTTNTIGIPRFAHTSTEEPSRYRILITIIIRLLYYTIICSRIAIVRVLFMASIYQQYNNSASSIQLHHSSPLRGFANQPRTESEGCPLACRAGETTRGFCIQDLTSGLLLRMH